MVSVATGCGEDNQSAEDKERAALSKAKVLAKALDDAIKAD